MTYLVDANVLSEATRPDPNPWVVEWLTRNESEIAVDPIILGELRFGILLLPRGRRRTRLERWFASGVQRIHCFPWRFALVGPEHADQGQHDRRDGAGSWARRRHEESFGLRESRGRRARPVFLKPGLVSRIVVVD